MRIFVAAVLAQTMIVRPVKAFHMPAQNDPERSLGYWDLGRIQAFLAGTTFFFAAVRLWLLPELTASWLFRQ